MIEAQEADGKLYVTSPYHPDLPSKARRLGGKWNKTHWVFDLRDKERVRKMYTKVYGMDWETEPELVTVQIEVEGWWSELHAGLFACGREIGRAWGRDSGARLGDVVILKGSVSSGGSMKNWTTQASPGTIIEMKDIPMSIAQKEIDDPGGDYKVKIMDDTTKQIESLKRKEEELINHLALVRASIEKLEKGEDNE